MRISDWSSDVCSSDLGLDCPPKLSACHDGENRRAKRKRRQPARLIVLILIADEVELPRLDLVHGAPVDQRLLAAVRDAHLPGRDFGEGSGELVPVGMVGDDQRQRDIALTGARSEEHTSETQYL